MAVQVKQRLWSSNVSESPKHTSGGITRPKRLTVERVMQHRITA